MDIKGNVKGIAIYIFLTFFSLCTLIWFSVFSYGILYYMYIPAVAHLKAVHLKYDMSCIGEKLPCKHPFDNITLIEPEEYEYLRRGQGYAIEIVLEMPESERNWNQGMFMIKLDMLDFCGEVVQSSHRPTILRYRSPLFKIIYTLFFIPGLLAGSFEEKQLLIVPLFEKYVEDSYRPAHFAHIEVQAKTAEIYSSSLRIHAQFTGLRYLMYYWPVTSAIIGIGSHFLFMCTTIILIWFREIMKPPKEDNQQKNSWQSSTNVKREVRRLPKKRPFLKPIGLLRDRTPEKKTDLQSRVRKEKGEIENLPAYRGPISSYDQHRNEERNIENQEWERNVMEEFYDAEYGDIASTSQNVTDIPSTGQNVTVPCSTLSQRITQILD